jgi:hypothetical protein
MKMIEMIFNIIFIGVAIGLAVKFVLLKLGIPFWSYYVVLPLLAMIFYVLNSFLTMHFIQNRAPEFVSTEEGPRGTQKWEMTAGTGIVPKWVSWIWVASIASLIALLMPFVAGLFKEKMIQVLPGKGIAGVELGMLENQVFSALGTPNPQLNKQQIERLGGVYRTDQNGRVVMVPLQEIKTEKIIIYQKPPVIILTDENKKVVRLSISFYKNVFVQGYPFLSFKYLSQDELSRLGEPSSKHRMKKSEEIMMSKAPPGTIYEYYEHFYDKIGINVGLLFNRTKQKTSKYFIGVNHIDVYFSQNE